MACSYSNCTLKFSSKYPSFSISPKFPPKLLSISACSKTPNHQDLHFKSKVDALVDSMKWDEKGLAVAIAQDIDTGDVLMQGFINKEALTKTIYSRKATFYSRSRSTLWTKGETSNNFINICDIFLDCDRDSVIYAGKPDGPTCHTGEETCYYTSVDQSLTEIQSEQLKYASSTLYNLESTIKKRKEEVISPSDKPSWTKRLLCSMVLLCAKIREEADELCQTLEENEDKSRTVSEMGDVLYHAMVLLSKKGVTLEEVFEEIRRRSKSERHKHASSTLYNLESTIEERKKEVVSPSDKPSYTRRLLSSDKLLCAKIRKAADGLCRTLEENEDKSGTVAAMADLVYHAMVLLSKRDVKVEDVFEELRRRFSQSGVDEKASRKS